MGTLAVHAMVAKDGADERQHAVDVVVDEELVALLPHQFSSVQFSIRRVAAHKKNGEATR